MKDTLTVKQFLSYEGVLTALDGPAGGLTSTNIGVSEPSSSPADYSVQLVGTGKTYAAFTWRSPTNASPDTLNVQQDPDCAPPQVEHVPSNSPIEIAIVDMHFVSGAVLVVASQPTSLTTRIEIFSYDAGGAMPLFGGLSNDWKLAASGLVPTGANNLASFLDVGQLGRGPVGSATNRFYAAGRSDLDSDNDGLFDSHEIFIYHTSPTNSDTDGDGVSDGPYNFGPDAFPLNASETADTDDDGTGDNADTDDDNDGLPDGSDPSPKVPITVAPFKVVNVETPTSGNFTSTYSSMTVAANWNSFNPGLNNMTLITNGVWEYVDRVNNTATGKFKFAANGSFGVNWGESGQMDTTLPITETAVVVGVDTTIDGPLNGEYRFRFNENTLAYTVDSASSDRGTELFDVSSSGRGLPYALGGNGTGGFGRVLGGIFFNHDNTNLYVGVAGLDVGGDNIFMLFLDTDGTNGGVSTLSGLSGDPQAFGTADNISFSSASFTPNAGILVGSRLYDGRNFPQVNIGGNQFGQGVYRLTPAGISNFPGFSTSAGAPFSQWGDRNANHAPANAGVEIKLAFTNLNIVSVTPSPSI